MVEQETIIKALKKQCSKTEAALEASQTELEVVRSKTAAIVSAAEDRLYWMDKYYLGPETFEKRRYVRVLVRALAFTRRMVGYLRRLAR